MTDLCTLPVTLSLSVEEGRATLVDCMATFEYTPAEATRYRWLAPNADLRMLLAEKEDGETVDFLPWLKLNPKAVAELEKRLCGLMAIPALSVD